MRVRKLALEQIGNLPQHSRMGSIQELRIASSGGLGTVVGYLPYLPWVRLQRWTLR